MSDNRLNHMIIFPESKSINQHSHTDVEAIDGLYSQKAIKRNFFYFPIQNSRSVAQIDLVVIDERSRFSLRHIVCTIWYQGKPVGIYDLASPHLFKDIRHRVFGIGNETLPNHMRQFIGDQNGIPAHDFRLHVNRQQSGKFFTDSHIENQVVSLIDQICNQIFSRLSSKHSNSHQASNFSKTTLAAHYNTVINL